MTDGLSNGPQADGPLTGMVVLDLTQILAGPMCTMVLGDLGADVIKVEKPNGGDDNRRMGPPFVKDWSAGFLAVNRNKRSLVVDLQREAGQTVFKRLAGDADAVIENFRPGVMERLGLGYQELAGINLRLVYCSISGFGNTGPYASRGGFDLVAQGVSGLMSITGHPGMPPAKVGVPITDLTAGLFAANGVQAAYIRALKTGPGSTRRHLAHGSRHRLYSVGVVGLLCRGRDTRPAGLRPPSLRALPSAADERRPP